MTIFLPLLSTDFSGGEMRCAYRESSTQQGCMILLGDRPLSITLKRAFGSLSLWQKAQFLWVIMREMKTDISQEDVEKCKSSDVLEELIEKLSQEFPTLHRVLVSERDLFLAHVLKSSASKLIMTTAGPQPALVSLASSNFSCMVLIFTAISFFAVCFRKYD